VDEIKSTTGNRIDEKGVNHPAHYNTDISGVECIDIVRYLDFNTGNAFKYLFRAGRKMVTEDTISSEIKDLSKAIWYLNDQATSVGILNTPRRDARHIYEDKMRKVIMSREGNIQEAMILVSLGFFESAISHIELEIKRLEEKAEVLNDAS
jgi:hypothetical protein